MAETDGAGDVVEAAGLGVEIVGGVGGMDVLVVVAAGELDVAFGGDVAGVVVVGDGVGLEEVVFVREGDVAGGIVDIVVARLRQIAFEHGALRLDRWQKDGVRDGGEIVLLRLVGVRCGLLRGRGFLARYRLCMQMLMRCGHGDGSYEKYGRAQRSYESWVRLPARAKEAHADADELDAEGLDETFH